jgi:hypothetical protein
MPALCRLAVSASMIAFDPSGHDPFARPRPTPAGLRTRQCAMYLAHVAFHLSQKRIASIFGRDPGTVRQGCARIEDARDSAAFDRALTHLEASGRAWARAFLGFGAGERT